MGRPLVFACFSENVIVTCKLLVVVVCVTCRGRVHARGLGVWMDGGVRTCVGSLDDFLRKKVSNS